MEDQPLELVVIIEVLAWFPASTASPNGDADRSVKVCLCLLATEDEVGVVVGNLQDL